MIWPPAIWLTETLYLARVHSHVYFHVYEPTSSVHHLSSSSSIQPVSSEAINLVFSLLALSLPPHSGTIHAAPVKIWYKVQVRHHWSLHNGNDRQFLELKNRDYACTATWTSVAGKSRAQAEWSQDISRPNNCGPGTPRASDISNNHFKNMNL